MRLSDISWPDVPAPATVLVPVGSVEQHGPHLPLDTDTVIAEAACRLAAERLDDPRIIVAPALTYGASGEHQSFAGTSSIGTAALRVLVVELVRSMRTWADRVVLVNGHGGNVEALTSAVTQLRYEGHDVAWLPCATEQDGDLHAGRTETSLLLHLCPQRVRLDRAVPGDRRPLAAILPAMLAGGVAAVSPNGVLGDPAGASAAEGARLLDAIARSIAAALRRVPA